jgi:hypothetical protein
MGSSTTDYKAGSTTRVFVELSARKFTSRGAGRRVWLVAYDAWRSEAVSQHEVKVTRRDLVEKHLTV